MGKDISEKKDYILIANFGKNGGGAGFLPEKPDITSRAAELPKNGQVRWLSTMAPLR